MTKLNQRKAGRRVLKLESLEDRRMMTQSPVLLAQASICGDAVARDFQGEEAAYFSGNGGGCGGRLDYEGLWRTDGTASGTFALGMNLVESIPINSLQVVHDKFYFNVVTGGRVTFEIYESNGAPNSARKFTEDVSWIVGHLNEQLLFSCSDTCRQFEASQLRAFDGLNENVLYEYTGIVDTEVNSGRPAKLRDAYFFGGDELWRLSESLELEGFRTPNNDLKPFQVAEVIGTTTESELYFWHGSDLWISDGTTSGTRPVNGGLRKGGTLIWDDELIVENAESLFIVDEDRATKLFDLGPSGGLIGQFGWQQYDWNGRKVFATNSQLVVTDGTSEGTSQIFKTTNDDFSSTLRMHHTDKYLFFEWAAFTRFTEDGIEKVHGIRRSDGSGSHMVGRGQLAATSRNAAFYLAEDEYWVLSDDESEPVLFSERFGVTPTDFHFTLDDGSILFSAMDGGEDRFWLTDGSREGTRVLSDHPPNNFGVFDLAYLGRFFQFQNKIIFDVEYGIDDSGSRLFSLTIPDPAHSLADLDGDGTVAFSDFLILSQNFGKTEASREDGDIDQNGVVEYADFVLLSENFGKRLG